MLLLPLVPSAHASARLADAPGAGRQDLCETVLQRDRHTCRFCGLPAGGWQDVFHLDDDHEHWTPANLAASCPLCHGVQHIGAPNANGDMHVIWLPEVEQPVLNVLVRGIHLILHAHDAATTLTTRHMPDEPELLAAWRAYVALDARKAAAARVIDSHHPRDLAHALAAMPPGDYGRRDKLLGGLRLLHRGQRLRQGKDLYPAQLAAWAKRATPSPS
jgi:intracellular multiplication protein IcmJ